MATVKHTPLNQGKNGIFDAHYTIIGDDISDIIEFCSTRVRPKSWGFYKEEIEKDLKKSGKSIIDMHAGMGIMYSIELNNND